MSDDKKPEFLPVRDGGATGHANERTMMASVPLEGFRTKLRHNADGTTTMLRTRGGRPEFTTTKAEGETATGYTYKLVGERMFYPSDIVPFGAYDLKVDFRAGNVTATSIPDAAYWGTDSTDTWKKYYRNLRWVDGSDSTKVIEYNSNRFTQHSARSQGYAPDHYQVFFGEPFDATMQDNMDIMHSAVAIFNMVVGGATYRVIATKLAYYNAATGGVMDPFGYAYNPPTFGGAGWQDTNNDHVMRSPGGRKVAYIDYNTGTPGVGTTRGRPSIFLHDDETEATTTIFESAVDGNVTASGGGVSSFNTATVLNYTASGWQRIDYIISANFEGEDLIPIYMRVDVESSGNGSYNAGTAPVTDDHAADYTAVVSFVRGDETFHTFTHGDSVTMDGSGTITHSSLPVAKVAGWLNAPEEHVHAIVVHTRVARSAVFSPPNPFLDTDPIDNLVEVRVFDFKSGREKVLHFADFEITGRPWMLGAGRAMVQPRPPPSGGFSFTASMAISWENYALTTSLYSRYGTVSPPPVSPSTTDATVEFSGNAWGASILRSQSGVIPIGVVGAIYADPKVIVLSVRNPADPTVYMNVAIDRKTWTHVNFDPGHGFQTLYKALDTIP